MVSNTDNTATVVNNDPIDTKIYEFELIIDNNEKKYIKKDDVMISTYVPIIIDRFQTKQGIFGKYSGKINVRYKSSKYLYKF